MKPKNTLLREFTGKIISLSNDFGTIASKKDTYNFNLQSCLYNVNLYDDVIFILQNDRTAIAVRKIYTNSFGIRFSVRVDQSHIHLNLENHLDSLIENISNSVEDYIEIEHEYTNVIGKSECVPTNEDDKIIFRKRKGRKGNSRFVLNREAEDCKSIFAAFKKNENCYTIITIFIGKKAGREPWDPLATSSDKVFWDKHALIYNEQILE